MEAVAILFPFNAPLLSLARILGHRGSPTVEGEREGEKEGEGEGEGEERK